MAGQVMAKFRENPDAWTQVDSILEFSNNQYTKFFALQILEALIKTRWRALPREQCEGIYARVVVESFHKCIRIPLCLYTVYHACHMNVLNYTSPCNEDVSFHRDTLAWLQAT